jgi:hypothetical protein
MVDVEVDSLFERSEKGVREARVAQTGCIHFLMQACRLLAYEPLLVNTTHLWHLF